MKLPSNDLFWQDAKNHSSKILVAGLVILTLAAAGFFTFYFWPKTVDNNTAAEKETGATGTAPTEETAPSAGSTASPTTPSTSKATTPSATTATSAADQYQVPKGETYFMSSADDTNGDGKKETLVITQRKDKKYHLYVLSSKGKKIFDNSELLKPPLRINLAKYDPSEKYSSWVLIFSEQSGEMAYLHWNGAEYEIPPLFGL